MVLVCFAILSNGRPTQTCVTNAREMRFWLDPHIGLRILTFHSQQKSNAFPAHFPRIARALKTHFTLCCAHSGVWAETGLTATGHAWEMRGKCVFVLSFACVCCLFCMGLVCFAILSNGRPTQTCVANAWEMRFWLDPHIGHRILTSPSQRKSNAFPVHFPRLARALKAHFTLCFAHSGVWAETGLTATGHAWEMRGKCVFVLSFACVCCLFCMVLVCFAILSNGRPTQTCVTNAWEMRFWLDPYIGQHFICIFFAFYSHLFLIVCLQHLISHTFYSHFQHIFGSHQNLIPRHFQRIIRVVEHAQS